MQAQRMGKDEKGAITLDENRAEFLAKLERECEEIRREMAENGKKAGSSK